MKETESNIYKNKEVCNNTNTQPALSITSKKKNPQGRMKDHNNNDINEDANNTNLCTGCVMKVDISNDSIPVFNNTGKKLCSLVLKLKVFISKYLQEHYTRCITRAVLFF